MKNENLLYVAILYVNSCPVGFINNLGFILSNYEPNCDFHCTRNGIIFLPYFPKSENHESVRFFNISYNLRKYAFGCYWAVRNLIREDFRIEKLPQEEIERRRNPINEKIVPAQYKAIECALLNRRKRIEEEEERKYKDWWKKNEYEQGVFYNGD